MSNYDYAPELTMYVTGSFPFCGTPEAITERRAEIRRAVNERFWHMPGRRVIVMIWESRKERYVVFGVYDIPPIRKAENEPEALPL